MDENLGDLNEASEPATSKHGLGIVLWVFVVLAVYVLSIGPAAGICNRRYRRSGQGDKLSRAAEVFYAPVLLLFHTPIRHALLSWMALWGGTTETPNSKVL